MACAKGGAEHRGAVEGKGPLRGPQQRLGRRLEEVGKSGWGRLLSVTIAIETHNAHHLSPEVDADPLFSGVGGGQRPMLFVPCRTDVWGDEWRKTHRRGGAQPRSEAVSASRHKKGRTHPKTGETLLACPAARMMPNGWRSACAARAPRDVLAQNYGQKAIPWFLGYSMPRRCPHSEAEMPVAGTPTPFDRVWVRVMSAGSHGRDMSETVRGHGAVCAMAMPFASWKHVHFTVERVGRSTKSPQYTQRARTACTSPAHRVYIARAPRIVLPLWAGESGGWGLGGPLLLHFAGGHAAVRLQVRGGRHLLRDLVLHHARQRTLVNAAQPRIAVHEVVQLRLAAVDQAVVDPLQSDARATAVAAQAAVRGSRGQGVGADGRGSSICLGGGRRREGHSPGVVMHSAASGPSRRRGGGFRRALGRK